MNKAHHPLVRRDLTISHCQRYIGNIPDFPRVTIRERDDLAVQLFMAITRRIEASDQPIHASVETKHGELVEINIPISTNWFDGSTGPVHVGADHGTV